MTVLYARTRSLAKLKNHLLKASLDGLHFGNNFVTILKPDQVTCTREHSHIKMNKTG